MAPKQRKKKAKEQCNVPGCESVSKRQGVCKAHLAENYVAKCTVENCSHELFARGRCRAHYMRYHRAKHGEKAPAALKPVRDRGGKLFTVFTRIPQETASVIIKAAGSRTHVYTQVQNILRDWAEAQG